jgi:RNA-directed DNA polymerase
MELKDFIKNNLTYINYVIDDHKSQIEFFFVKKRNGDLRKIIAPINCYKMFLISLNKILIKYYNPPKCVHGFIFNKNILTNAKKHLNKFKILKLDLQNFFPSISIKRVKALFVDNSILLSENEADLLSRICTYEEELPQGFPTSPIISNMICFELDRKLSKIAAKNNFIYSRYADDLTFSTNDKDIANNVKNEIINTVESEDFNIKHEKTKFKGKHRRQLITGIIVNEKLSVKKSYKKKIRAILHNWEISGIQYSKIKYLTKYFINDKKNLMKFLHSLKGKIEFIGFVQGRTNSEFLRLLNKYHFLCDRDKNIINNSM